MASICGMDSDRLDNHPQVENAIDSSRKDRIRMVSITLFLERYKWKIVHRVNVSNNGCCCSR
jgi:hypothetical protein